jgi:hypothetical protein
MAEEKGNPVVRIASVLGGVSLAIVVIIAVLARDQLSIAPWIVWALAAMGIGLGFVATRSSNPE